MSSDDYPTDSWIQVMFEGWYDPCYLSDGNLREVDGLGSSWKDKTFVNPPYSKPLPWIEQAIREHQKGKTIALLLKADTSTRWFAALQNAGAKFLWVNGRLKHGTGKPANFPSMIAILKSEGSERSETLFVHKANNKGDLE